MAKKYGYGEVIAIRTVEQAREIDSRYRACPRCSDKIKEQTGRKGRRERRDDGGGTLKIR